jgi:hypothetical protein
MLCNQGLGVQINRQTPGCGWVTQPCSEELLVVDEDGN